MDKDQTIFESSLRLAGKPVKVSIKKHREPFTPRDIAEIVFDEYDTGRLKPDIARTIARRAAIDEKIAELLVEVIDVCYDLNSEEWDEY